MTQTLIRVDAYYCTGKDHPSLHRAVLPPDFKLSCRVFNVADLHIIDVERIYGSFFNPTYVRGVVDTKGSLIPFFIPKQKVKQLQDLINANRDKAELIL